MALIVAMIEKNGQGGEHPSSVPELIVSPRQITKAYLPIIKIIQHQTLKSQVLLISHLFQGKAISLSSTQFSNGSSPMPCRTYHPQILLNLNTLRISVTTIATYTIPNLLPYIKATQTIFKYSKRWLADLTSNLFISMMVL